ncbi:MAG: MerR family transcriptional regulator [Gammaproteobacteria bacterium]|jgi:Hg(II)-responsive transcriptional regulator|nr:MerR family transcriptional regulator [Gammaproteobacteria bacterium]MDP6617306.1 MerR family transcriptional regulator [Gammaproteobacteria bacterium]MDP6694084.1 MerR family transcriptional regulator [Gammaproteobacteria bacterium]MDP7041105.1 MerR family transcriptional regulator [Gammaproteobacteria bacterium]
MDTPANPSRLTIGRLSRQAGVGIDTVRFYERRGLLPSPARSASGYRLYGEDTIARIRFIRRAKGLGFTLDEIETLLRLQDQGGKKSAVRKLTENKLAQINTKIDDLERMREVLKQLSSECNGRGNVDSCPIIEALASEEE